MIFHDPNTMAILFLSILLASQLLETTALLFNMNHLQKPLPEPMGALLDAATWKLTQQYTQAKHRLELIESVVSLVALLFFWFWGGFNLLDHWVASWQYGSTLSGMFYIGILLVLSYILGVPFVVYGTFGVEARFGFNRTTWVTFVGDQIKMMVLAILLGGPFIAGILTLFDQVGPYVWLVGWLGASAFSLVLQMVIPRWIMPLFNRFSPLADGELRQAIFAYAETIHFPLANIFEMDGSRRSSKTNAFITGFGKNRRIALFDTLIQQHTVAELVAVLAHEVGHSRRRHILKMFILGTLHLGFFFFLLGFFLTWPNLYQGFFMDSASTHAGLVFFSILIGRVDLFFAILLKKLSRRFEFEADRFALETIPEPTALASALRTLAKENLANLMPHPLYVMLHHSHPPLLERLAALENFKR